MKAEDDATREGDLFDPSCPSRMALDRVGDKWTVMVVELLARHRAIRFTELKVSVRGVTPKVLTQTLRSLERDGLVRREVFAEVPPRVEYSLTELGRSLRRPVAALRAWAQEHVGEIVAAQERYDRRNQS
jgi:DNA-binding HxlR family transcriptional regulator